MTALALWTWVAVGVLIVLPPVVFVLFLRDARKVFEDLTEHPAPPPPAEPE